MLREEKEDAVFFTKLIQMKAIERGSKNIRLTKLMAEHRQLFSKRHAKTIKI